MNIVANTFKFVGISVTSFYTGAIIMYCHFDQVKNKELSTQIDKLNTQIYNQSKNIDDMEYTINYYNLAVKKQSQTE